MGGNRMTAVSKLMAAAALFAALPSIGALAADHKVWMKNKDSDGQPMQFEPAFLKIAAGDTVTFVPVDAGHNTETISAPEGTEPWYGNLDQQTTVTFNTDGLYAYRCAPHVAMGMVGLIQVGNAVTGIDPAKVGELPAKAKDRMKGLLAQAGAPVPN